MTHAELNELISGIVPVIKSLKNDINNEIGWLKKRVAELDEKPALKYCGIWKSDGAYGQGDLVTHGGSIWHCNRSTKVKPGDGSDWQLAVKRGADGGENSAQMSSVGEDMGGWPARSTRSSKRVLSSSQVRLKGVDIGPTRSSRR